MKKILIAVGAMLAAMIFSGHAFAFSGGNAAGVHAPGAVVKVRCGHCYRPCERVVRYRQCNGCGSCCRPCGYYCGWTTAYGGCGWGGCYGGGCAASVYGGCGCHVGCYGGYGSDGVYYGGHWFGGAPFLSWLF
jgi:hypothetical protein